MNRAFASVVTSAAITIASNAFAAETWDMPTAYPASNYHTENIQRFADAVKDATGGEIEIVVHPNGSLFKGNEIKRAVQTGQAQIGERLLAAHSNENPLFGVDELPFIATSLDASAKLYKASRPAMEKLLEEQNLKLLFSVPWPPQGLLSTIEVDEVEDLRGAKMRAATGLQATIIGELGAVPTQIEAAELSQAYATGLVQAHFTSGATPWDSKLYEQADYYYDFGAWVSRNTVFINLDVWNGLDERTQGVIEGAAAMAERTGWAKADELAHWYAEQLASKGMKVQPPSDQLVSELKEIGQKVLDSWLEGAGDTGKAIIEDYRNM